MSLTIVWPFKMSNVGSIQYSEEDEDSIESIIKYLLSIKEGEMLGEPEKGSKLYLLAFETDKVVIDAMSRLYIKDVLDRYLSDIVTVKDVYSEFNENHEVIIYLNYEILSSGESRTITVPLNTGGVTRTINI